MNSGSLRGVSVHDPVITADGLVGYVSEVQATYSVVETVLSPNLNVGVIDSRTRETGILAGSESLSGKGKTRLSYLSRNSSVAMGITLLHRGVGGVFPGELSSEPWKKSEPKREEFPSLPRWTRRLIFCQFPKL